MNGVFSAVVAILVAAVMPLQITQREWRGNLLERKGKQKVTTKDTVEGYFSSLKQKKGWELFLADDMIFDQFTSPVKHIEGKTAYLEATRRFYSSVASVDVRELLIEGEKACALTHYELRTPTGSTFRTDIAEIFTVRNGKIKWFAIYFDTAPFPK